MAEKMTQAEWREKLKNERIYWKTREQAITKSIYRQLEEVKLTADILMESVAAASGGSVKIPLVRKEDAKGVTATVEDGCMTIVVKA